MMKQKKLKTTLIMIQILALLKPIETKAFSFGTSSSGSGGISESVSLGEDGNGCSYTCHYTYYANKDTTIKIDAYDTNDNYIVKNEINIQKNIIAGTSLGLNIYEVQNISWGVNSTNVTSTMKFSCYICEGSTIGPPISYNPIKFEQVPKCWTEIRNDASKGSCRPICGVVAPAGYESRCESIARARAQAVANQQSGPSYYVEYPDSNDIANSEDVIKKDATDNCVTTSQRKKCSYEYNLNETCINVKTAKISYDGNCKLEREKAKEDIIYTVPKVNNHWHYFIPLNAKSDSDFSIKLMSKTSIDAQECKIIIDNYENYRDLILDSNKEKFTGNKQTDKINIDKSKKCYLGSVVKIPIIQKFYNEEGKDNNITFKGFNFYYRQIDVNNPFPNGIAEDSYWTDLYDAVKNIIKTNNGEKDVDIKLSDSFKEITYKAENISLNNINNIRNLNDENPYTNWDNMNVNGTSNFVNKNLTVSNGKAPKFKLGCGPHNIKQYLDDEKTQKNPYYQKECVE